MGRKKNHALDEQVVALADSGLGNIEIAKIIGSTRAAVERRLRSVSYKRTDEQKRAIYQRAYVSNGIMPPHKPLEVREAEFAAKFDEREELANLEYIGGYVGRECSVTVRCKTCGNEFTRWAKSLTRAKDPICFCPHCKKKSKKPKPKRRLKLYQRNCSWCGSSFMAQGREVYCSRDCYRSASKVQIKRRIKELGLNSCIRRAKHYGVAYEYGITLEKLIERDNNKCHICGGDCDKNDRAYGHVGPNYPTQDHVIPLAKGGPHLWWNVKLAHFQCNSEKSDHIGDENDNDHACRHGVRHAFGTAEDSGASPRRRNRQRGR